MGPSMGALLVRQAYLIGLGSRTQDFGVEPWAKHVSRPVLFAGINRGISLTWPERLAMLLLITGNCLLRNLLIGSDFVTNLRLWWMRKLSQPDAVLPTVIQVLGDRDTLQHANPPSFTSEKGGIPG